MHDTVKRRALLAAVPVLAAPRLGSAQEEAFPSRPIRFIVPWTPGGPSDATARSLAVAAGRVLGVPIVIENRPGVAGTLGPSSMAQGSRPDGYTICQMPINVFRYPALARASYDPVADFTWIIRTGGYTFNMGVRADAPWRSLAELTEQAKREPGAISFASNGIGGTPHLIMARIAAHDGTDLLHVPFRGWAESVNALLGRQVQLMSDSGPWQPLVEDGRVRLLATWGATRSRLAPEVPTLKELGYDIVSNSPYGIAGPRGMDPHVTRIVHDAFRAALDDPDYKLLVERLDQVPAYLGSEDYRAYAEQTAREERELIERLGLRRG
ncbi:tripartite tricarboxylate transporter substrate binding protein [Roseococcus sp. SYP-B2431]|uniref:tripartite tricarboxylate transporter substrate binding protein n=1 Tax=Roseococcus sp. SYP-B2431 TaxID=2496640 RepID=UPI00103D94E6|nr:tripartite tricarboxylate transporter substrate binding protein [Roseococcus sp. SYP-B2431]TCH98301.1 tripartite tricarboxylate transporter substrate binding protein [Roseococcus sp. SYP-B2431]